MSQPRPSQFPVHSAGALAGPLSARIAKAAAAALLGCLFLFVAGFAGADILHDAAHDSRHSFSFPCH